MRRSVPVHDERRSSRGDQRAQPASRHRHGIHLGGVMAEVEVAVGEHRIVSVITRRSVEELGLAVGDEVTVVIKSTEVMLAKDDAGPRAAGGVGSARWRARPHRALADRVGRARAARRASRRTGGTSRVPSRRTARSGTIWTVSRPLVYRAITVLRELGYVEDRGSAPSSSGPQRVLLAPTPRGRAAFRRWLAPPGRRTFATSAPSSCSSSSSSSARGSIGGRSCGRSSTSSSAARTASSQRVAASEGFDRTVAIWRLTSARAARAFVEALLDERAEEPVQYHAIGVVRSAHTRARRDAAAARRRPDRAVADRRHASRTAAASSTSTASRMSG